MGDGELVGRNREIGALEGWLDAALDGRPRLVLCGGEPGIGKTRLASQLAAIAQAKGVPVRWARAAEDAGSPPYWLWRQAAGSGAEWPTPLPAAQQVAGGEGLDASAERFLLFEDVTRRILDDVSGQGSLLVLDDVQWADPSSLLLLRHLVRALRGDRLLVVATHRTVGAEATAGWRAVLPDLVREPVTERIDLRGLSEADTVRCLCSVTHRAVADRLGPELYRVTSGNPFFVQEVGRMLATTDSPGEMVVPASVLDVIAQRVERLPEPTQRLLAAASILGERFPVAVAASLVDRPVSACLGLAEQAEDAGLLTPSGTPGDWQFVHGLIRDAVESGLPLAERVRLHQAAGVAIERTYAGNLEPRLAELARHWAAVAVVGDRKNAVQWAARAAEEAMRALAYEEAARLYQLALDAGGPDIDEERRCRLLLQVAAAHWRSADLGRCQEACLEVVALARRMDRPDLLGEAALTMEAIGELAWDLGLRRLCDEALAGLGDSDDALRARLLARLTEASVYVGEEPTAEQTSRDALELADRSGEPTATIAALGARQLACSGPEYVEERTLLAQRMIDAGLVLRRPATEMRGRLWMIDVYWERGDLAAIASSVGRLAWCVEHVRGPLPRWHLVVTRAALAQALGRFTQARELGLEAFESVRSSGHPAAFGAYMSLLAALGHHIGHDRAGGLKMLAGLPPIDTTEVRNELFGHIGPGLMYAEAGQMEAAAMAYRRAGLVRRWRPPPYFRVLAWSVGSALAMALGERDDVELLRGRLLAERGPHAVGGAGNASYFGPVGLYLGRTAAHLGRWDDAALELSAASARCHEMGAAGFVVEADCELAAVLAQRGADGDVEHARELVASTSAAAAGLGMVPWKRRAAALSATLGAPGGPAPSGRPRAAFALSPREMEVARLVSDGKTNREIAAALFVSERTAQTHVQHILTKLGFSNRSQIASWVSSEHGTGASPAE